MYNENVNNPFYLQSVGITHYPNTSSSTNNISLASNNVEAPGLENAPEWNDKTIDSTSTNSLGTSLLNATSVATGATEHNSVGTVAKASKFAGKNIFYVSAAVSVFKARDAFNRNDAAGFYKAVLDIGVGVTGVMGGPVGIGFSAVYYTLDSLGYVDSAFRYIENKMSNPGRNSLNSTSTLSGGILGRNPPAY